MACLGFYVGFNPFFCRAVAGFAVHAIAFVKARPLLGGWYIVAVAIQANFGFMGWLGKPQVFCDALRLCIL
jgi:hypothetical protein